MHRHTQSVRYLGDPVTMNRKRTLRISRHTQPASYATDSVSERTIRLTAHAMAYTTCQIPQRFEDDTANVVRSARDDILNSSHVMTI
ncbi:hypothetical protein THER5_1900 [Bifidobacterium thermacidophilum subsp. thermacidophilum]|uniref:Uncharacterized protein n=1 Tax=Bifidobacterium thermacidophilum subsp. thermacidophilum TaxID=79262 RepID=A0A087E282_9BIFI|nr:hypothetical protein THER5_1900 [Bifidobacterium thermacidophilum subsp. thermacidophilum]